MMKENTSYGTESLEGASRNTLYVIKIGGNIIDDESKLEKFLSDFADIATPIQGTGAAKKILVHGGGKLATNLAKKLGIDQKLVDGRRITDAETLKIVTMVYAGYINKFIVAQLHGHHCNAIGLSGADGNLIVAHKRQQQSSPASTETIDFGYAGDIDHINSELLDLLLTKGFTIVVAPITHDKNGQLLNTNADTIAHEVAKAMAKSYDTTLIYTFEKAGVLLDVNDDDSVISNLNRARYQELKTPVHDTTAPKIFAGMIPKLDNAFAAIDGGVKKVTIGKAEQLIELINGTSGTNIVNE